MRSSKQAFSRRGPQWAVIAMGVASLLLLVGLVGPVGAAPRGHVQAPIGVGYFYGTFDQDPNLVLLVGGTAEEFCEDVGPGGDAFAEGEPGSAPARIFSRHDGSTDIKVDDKDQPVHLYEAAQPAPVWIDSVCDAHFGLEPTPDAIASGYADLKVRVSEGADGMVDVFNSVSGMASAPDGSTYKIKASADLIVDNGVPVGDPAEFVNLDVRQIRR